jgi:transposase-like protein
MSKNGQRYNQQFKDDILRLINEEKRSVSSIVKDFGVNNQTVRNWLKESKDRHGPLPPGEGGVSEAGPLRKFL